MNRWGLV